MAGEIITASKVAALLKINVRTVYRLARAGVIPGNRIRRMWRFTESEILGLVAGRREQQKDGNQPNRKRGIRTS